ncbi:hypothetical protein BC835DRAFT_1422969 [Cytidiella melzeri]|nr:hypothetical protein BC835DRAFT_1422969 [Cytidiella melzeri]
MSSRTTDPPLPDYSEDRELPPNYTPPKTYKVGGHTLYAPLVRVAQVKAHLCLLRAIKNLRTVVEDGQDGRFPSLARDLAPPQRWGWFINLAVERFWRWVKVVKLTKLSPWIHEELPPLDVLMVWHTYMLNPVWYSEDCDRLPDLQTLKKLGQRLLSTLIAIEDINTHEADAERKASWEAQTNTPFDPIDSAGKLTQCTVPCPMCTSPVVVMYINKAGTGYAQQGFQARCQSCEFLYTKVDLAVRKFAHNLVLDHHDPAVVGQYGKSVFMAGTLRTIKRDDNSANASTLKDKLRVAYPLSRPPGATSAEWEKHILKVTEGAVIRLKAAAAIVLARGGIRVQRVLSAYTDEKPFSVDLVNAVMRQCSFVDKMHQFGWTSLGFFDSAEDEIVLQHAITRYHGFLDLLSVSQFSFMVPTLDIDLVWHTHQLTGTAYHEDCGEYLNRFVDHDDKIEESFLATSFDESCRAWKERFGAPYTYCGCPLPGERIGERFARLKQRMQRTKNETDSDLLPINHANGSAATHPSEHNTFVTTAFERDTDARRKYRAEKVRRREKRAKMQQGEHEPAFLYPIPFFGQVPESGCVVVGTVNSHDLGCAVGAGACSGGGARGQAACIGENLAMPYAVVAGT